MTILTDSLARDHAESLQASAAASRRARELRQRRRAERRAERAHRKQGAGGGVTARRVAGRPFAAARAWLVAGQL